MDNLEIAKSWLKQAILNRDSEKPIRDYIKFMDTLPQTERDNILLNPAITGLIDQINRHI